MKAVRKVKGVTGIERRDVPGERESLHPFNWDNITFPNALQYSTRLSAHLGDGALSQISSRLGADQGATSKAIAAAVPLLLARSPRMPRRPTGAQQLHDAVTRDHDGSVLDNPDAVGAAAACGQGDAILGHILGDRQSLAEQGISRRRRVSTCPRSVPCSPRSLRW